MKIEFRIIRDDSSVVDRTGYLANIDERFNPSTGKAFAWNFEIFADELDEQILRPQDCRPSLVEQQPEPAAKHKGTKSSKRTNY